LLVLVVVGKSTQCSIPEQVVDEVVSCSVVVPKLGGMSDALSLIV